MMVLKRFIQLFILGILLAAGSIPTSAQTVTEKRAQNIAKTFFLHDRNTTLNGAEVRLIADPAAPATKGPALPAYYIFNRDGGGFVIVSAEEACIPVLAYSYTNSFDAAEVPENLKDLLEQWHEQVEYVRSRSIRADAQDKMRWMEAETLTKAGAGEYQTKLKHETALWSQKTPFNDKAPTVDGKKASAGCSAVAMGTIMRFWCYPDHGTGVLPSYYYTTDNDTRRLQPGHALGHIYDWSKIKLNYKSGYTEEEGAQVAQLIYDCGVMAQSSFDSSTGATATNMITAAITYMGYDKGATIYERGYFSDEEWIRMLKEELQTQPIYYTGRTEKNSGHAFIVDGYDDKDYLSVNWGWASDANGYYQLSAFSPSSSRSYTLLHHAVFGLRPDHGGAANEYLCLSTGTSTSGQKYYGLMPSLTIIPDREFEITIGWIESESRDTFNGKVALALADKDDKIREFISDELELSLSPSKSKQFSSVPCLMTLAPEPGDKVRLFYCSDKDGEWKPVYYNREEEGIVGEIFIYDCQTIEASTSFSYDRDFGTVEFNTHPGLNWMMTDSRGIPVTEGVFYEGSILSINTTMIPEDTYTLTLSKGNDTKAFTIKMGSKK
jgi:Peptidase C10 family.